MKRLIWARSSVAWLKLKPIIPVPRQPVQRPIRTPDTPPIPPPMGSLSTMQAFQYNLSQAFWYNVQQVPWQLWEQNWMLYIRFTADLDRGGVNIQILDDVFGAPERFGPGEAHPPQSATALPDLDTILNESADPYKDLSITDLLNEPVYQNPPPPLPPPQDPPGGRSPEPGNPGDSSNIGPFGNDEDGWIAFFDAVNAEKQPPDGGGGRGHVWMRPERTQ